MPSRSNRIRWRNIAQNLGLISVSFLLALWVWVAAVQQENPIETRVFDDVPVEFVAQADNVVLVNRDDLSLLAEVIVRTQRSVLRDLDPRDVRVEANLDGLGRGTHQVSLEPVLPDWVRALDVRVRPAQISVELDVLVESRIPITIEIGGSPALGYEAQEPQIETQVAVVSGPASLVEQVAEVAGLLSINGERNTVVREVTLHARDENGHTVSSVELSPRTVSVTVPIEPREGYREVYVVPDLRGELPEGYSRVRVEYSPQSIIVGGPQDALDNMAGVVNTEPIDLTGHTETFVSRVGVVIPDSRVFPYTGQTIEVRVVIEPVLITRAFEGIPVELEGVGPNLQAHLAVDVVNILITGPQQIVEDLTEDGIRVVADVSDMGPGVHQVRPRVYARGAIQEADVLPEVIEVELIVVATNTPTPTTSPTPTPTPTEIPPTVTPSSTPVDTRTPTPHIGGL